MRRFFMMAMVSCALGFLFLIPTARADAHDVLQTLAKHTAPLQSLYTTFTQEKKITVLSKPLLSQGYMCMQKAQSEQKERLVWAYIKPQASGFAAVGKENFHWNGPLQQGQMPKRAQGPEAMALKTVSEHIRAWVQVSPEHITRLYTVQSTTEEGVHILILQPKQKQNFFETLKVKLTSALDGVQELTFLEKNGDSMRISFANPQRNTPLPAACFIVP